MNRYDATIDIQQLKEFAIFLFHIGFEKDRIIEILQENYN